MDLLRLCLLAVVLCTTLAGAVGEVGEVLDDFPLDDPGGATDRVDEGGGDPESNNLEDIDLSDLQETEANRQELLRKVMSAAMAKPGARQRLAQVMPILRTMSATQRLALAGLVTSQLMAPPGAPLPNTTRTNLTDDLMIPISMDIAAMFRGLGRDTTAARSNLFRGELYKTHPPYRRRPVQTPNRRNTEVPYGDMRPPPLLPSRVKPPKLRPQHPPNNNIVPDSEAGTDCEYFTNTLCLQVADYPIEAILQSIQSTPNKNAFEALRKDAKQDFGDLYPVKEVKIERRSGGLSIDSQENQHMCSSKVEIARPKRARATSGQWKYVVNTGDYTQTLRLEMCLRPKQACSYLADNLNSECTQVYNYHRLLTWDKMAGLTMDIFKVPTCCSCHVHGLSHLLPGKTFTQTTSESVRHPSQPVEPVRHATPPPRITQVTEGLENNFVVADDGLVVHRLPPAKVLTRRPYGNHQKPPTRPRPHYEGPEEHPRFPPQYENLLRRTISRNSSDYQVDSRPKYHPVLPTLNQRHPELPVDSLLAGDTFSYVTSEPDYLPSRNQDHRYQHNIPPHTTYSTSTKRVVHQTTHPSTPKRPTYQTTIQPPTTVKRLVTNHGTTTSPPNSKRVNYSYHPIIDFFKTGAASAQVERGGGKVNNAEWTPIVDGPRIMPK